MLSRDGTGTERLSGAEGGRERCGGSSAGRQQERQPLAAQLGKFAWKSHPAELLG